MNFVVSFAILLVMAGTGITEAQFLPNQCIGANGPICEDYEQVLAAAQAAMNVYNATQDQVLVAIKRGEEVKSAVQLVDDEENGICTVAYRGADAGFEWIADIDMRLSYFSVKDKKKKKCRVVKHYKTLYTQPRYQTSYKQTVDIFLEDCRSLARTILLTGHDLGGAIATMAALEYAKMPHLKTFVFGAPPVFMPPQYQNPLRLGKAARKKHPCQHLSGKTYTTFINAGLVTDGVLSPMYYDFMPFLNFAIYFHVDDEGSGVTPLAGSCFDKAADNVQEFLASGKRGNLGSMYGSRYLFPDPAASPGEVNYLAVDRYEDLVFHPNSDKRNRGQLKNPDRLVSFGNQGINYIQPGYLSAPELLENTECGPSNVPNVHSMERYLQEVSMRGVGDDGLLNQLNGWGGGVDCLMNSDCQSRCCLVEKEDPQRQGRCLNIPGRRSGHLRCKRRHDS